jgi:hypothetical protein
VKVTTIQLDRSDLAGTLESGSNDLQVSSVMQKAVIEVNEKSTEAAAATAITITNRLFPLHTSSPFSNHSFSFDQDELIHVLETSRDLACIQCVCTLYACQIRCLMYICEAGVRTIFPHFRQRFLFS